jgi:hypothetical protein
MSLLWGLIHLCYTKAGQAEAASASLQNTLLQLPVEITIFEHNLEENIELLKETVRQGTYAVKSLRKIWVPKRKFLLRPGSIPHLEDRILFQALIDKIAPTLEAQLLPFEQGVVFSSRLNQDPQSENMFEHKKGLWLQFQEKAVAYCDTSGIRHVLVSDIGDHPDSCVTRRL